jgi:chorismate mutase
MQNQSNRDRDFEQKLQKLRSDINQVDEEIIKLLKQRMEIIKQVGELKKSSNEKFFIRSNREADMIRDLVDKADGSIPKSTIVNIWRKIITTANVCEQSIKIAIHNPKKISDYNYLTKEYYGEIVPIIDFDSVNNVVLAIEKQEVQIGIFPLPSQHFEDFHKKEELNENWWINLANNKLGIKVFAIIPFIETKNNHQNFDSIKLVAAAIKKPEKSRCDNSLFYVEIDEKFSKSQINSSFKEAGIEIKLIKSVKLSKVENVIFYLLEASGFIDENDERIKLLNKSKIKPYIKILGHFANPIKVE